MVTRTLRGTITESPLRNPCHRSDIQNERGMKLNQYLPVY
jgi:hypothetical protein